MKTLQHFLPGFNRVIGRGPQSPLARIQRKASAAAASSLSDLIGLFGEHIPDVLLEPSKKKAHSRKRVYSMRSTFWAFLSQALTPRQSCAEVARRVQSFCSQHKLPVPGGSSSAYCQARGKLCFERLNSIHEEVSQSLLKRTQRS